MIQQISATQKPVVRDRREPPHQSQLFHVQQREQFLFTSVAGRESKQRQVSKSGAKENQEVLSYSEYFG